jgi:hypothetical protein
VRDVQWGSVVSLVIGGAYIVSAFARMDPYAGVQMTLFCVLPLACIWFPEALGDYIGGRITAESNPTWVKVLGWIVLMVPMLERAFWYFGGGRNWIL